MAQKQGQAQSRRKIDVLGNRAKAIRARWSTYRNSRKRRHEIPFRDLDGTRRNGKEAVFCPAP
jgi:hypothetical protein